MPLLTRENLDSIVAELESVWARDVPSSEQPFVWACKYGTEHSYLADSEYAHLVAASITDPRHRTYPNGSTREELERLLEEIDEYRVAHGAYDVVIAIGSARSVDAWAAAASDADGAACEARCAATPISYHTRGEEADENIHRVAIETGIGVLSLGSEERTLLECLECGAVHSAAGHVEPGGMGCDRCNA